MVAEISVGTKPEGLSITPDGTPRLTCITAVVGDVSVIDLSTNTVIHTITNQENRWRRIGSITHYSRWSTGICSLRQKTM